MGQLTVQSPSVRWLLNEGASISHVGSYAIFLKDGLLSIEL